MQGVPGASCPGWADVFLVLREEDLCHHMKSLVGVLKTNPSVGGSSAQGAAGGESLVKSQRFDIRARSVRNVGH